MALALLAPFFWRMLKLPALSILVSLIIVFLISIGIVPYRSFIYWIPVYLMGASCGIGGFDSLVCFLQKDSVCKSSIVLVIAYIVSAWFLPNGIARTDMTWYQNLAFILFRIITPLVWLPIMLWMSKLNVKERQFMHYSFFVFCMHFPFITLLGIVYDRTVHRYTESETIKYLTIVFLSYSLCVISAMFLQRFTPKLWKVLNGRRK